MSVTPETGGDSIHSRLIKLRFKAYANTGKEPTTVYLGYHEWDCLLCDPCALVFPSPRDASYRYDGCELVPVNKLSHMGIGYD